MSDGRGRPRLFENEVEHKVATYVGRWHFLHYKYVLHFTGINNSLQRPEREECSCLKKVYLHEGVKDGGGGSGDCLFVGVMRHGGYPLTAPSDISAKPLGVTLL